MSIERIRRDRVLHEALTARADQLHLALVFGLSHATASKYTLIACDLLADQAAEAAEEQQYVPGGPGGIPELSGVEAVTEPAAAGPLSLSFLLAVVPPPLPPSPAARELLRASGRTLRTCRERAETYLRQLAEAELWRARTLPAALFRKRRDTARLALVAQALVAVGAVDVGTADQIRADLELAVVIRQPGQVNQASPGQRGLSPDARMRLARLMHSPPRRAATAALPVSGLSAGHTRPAPQRASWRAVPVGQVIPIRDDDVRRELLVVAYVQFADGARFTMADWPFRPFTFTAVDDRGASYQIGFPGEMAPGELLLRPDPPHQIRWLDLTTAPGEPAIRIDLDPQIPVPEVTVTRKATSPGELLLDVIAARILTSAAASPQDNPGQPAANAHLRAFVSDGPGHSMTKLPTYCFCSSSSLSCRAFSFSDSADVTSTYRHPANRRGGFGPPFLGGFGSACSVTAAVIMPGVRVSYRRTW